MTHFLKALHYVKHYKYGQKQRTAAKGNITDRVQIHNHIKVAQHFLYPFVVIKSIKMYVISSSIRIDQAKSEVIKGMKSCSAFGVVVKEKVRC